MRDLKKTVEIINKCFEHSILLPDYYYDEYEKIVSDVDSSQEKFTTTDIADQLGMSAQHINNILEAAGIIYKVGSKWKLEEYLNEDDFLVKTKRTTSNGNVYYETHWTLYGAIFIIDLLYNLKEIK